MPFLIVFTGLLVGPAISIFWGGYVASVLWFWFVVPLGAPAISTTHAAGLSCVVSTFMGSRGLYQGEQKNKSPEEAISTALGVVILIPLVVLTFGWLIHAGM